MSNSSVENLKVFEERLKRIDAMNRKSGRATRKSSGEYFRKEEERRKRRRSGRKANWTFRILLVVVALFATKTYIMVDMGQQAYDARMAELGQGDKYQKIAAMALAPDPISGKLQELLQESGILDQINGPAPVDPAAIPADPAAVPEPESKEAGATSVEPASSSVVTADTAN